MSDTSLPVIIRFDTAANRAAFTPDPGIAEQLYIWLDSDDQPNSFYWDGANWQAFAIGAGAGIDELTGDVTAGPGSGAEAATLAVDYKVRTFGVNINGNGSAITTGVKGYIEVPFDITLTGWTILSQDGLSGDIVIDIWNDTYANFPPDNSDSITAGNEPEISGDDKATGNVAGWSDTTIAAGSILGFNVDSASVLTHVIFQLYGTVTI